MQLKLYRYGADLIRLDRLRPQEILGAKSWIFFFSFRILQKPQPNAELFLCTYFSMIASQVNVNICLTPPFTS